MDRLTNSQVAARIKKLSGWKTKGDAIRKSFAFKNYYETMAFVNATAWISHREDHHPDLEVGYNKCAVTYSTHSAGGVTAKDFDCAAKIEKLMGI
jgi:4a-hydroxytetrahydrobiopterin dehydratase